MDPQFNDNLSCPNGSTEEVLLHECSQRLRLESTSSMTDLGLEGHSSSSAGVELREMPGGCPFGIALGHQSRDKQEGELDYGNYLNVDQLLSCQKPIECGKATHDQMLFIITHQVYELWFKQVLFEIDSIRELFIQEYLNETKMLVLNNRLQRIVLIFKTMVDQFSILETMTSLDFMDFRPYLKTSSGFQSLQFRLLEVKLGIKDGNRVNYNKMPYKSAFVGKAGETPLMKASSESSLLELVEKWLERTPGLSDEQMNLWNFYARGVEKYLNDFFKKPAEEETDPAMKALKEADYLKQKETFETILDPAKYNYFLEQKERSLSHKAFKGAMLISLYRDMPRFSPAFQTLTLLVDIDALLVRWRLNHLMMVQRMIGTKMGTGGSSGYQYLRATVSDRYKPFLDLTNLTTFLIPREYISSLSKPMQRRLSTIHMLLSMDVDVESEAGDDHGHGTQMK